MSMLKEAFEAGKFGVTAEMAPPKGYDFSEQLEAAKLLNGKVHGVNVTDMQSASLKASSLGLCVALKNAGIEPILQMTGRDRNRMAIMGDVLSAAAFGIDTMLALTGDHPVVGDCPESKPVYDLDSVGILKMLCQSYIRDTIGLYDVDSVITTGKSEIQAAIKQKVVTRLESEDIGLQLTNITIQDAEPPTAEVQQDIVRLLELHDPVRCVTGFDRPNLFFDVQRPKNKMSALLDLLRTRRDKTGIVYCATRAAAERVCRTLCSRGVAAVCYHAGMEDGERRASQDDFQFDRKNVIVATNAFGMGIDKSNVNFVIHYNMPKSLEAYYQEAGAPDATARLQTAFCSTPRAMWRRQNSSSRAAGRSLATQSGKSCAAATMSG